jgi:hypothetical protein
VAAISAVGFWVLAGCGGSSKVSSASLMSRLAPESVAPGFHLVRTLDWSDPANLVAEGFRLPERTHPSQAIKEINGAGFEGAVGEQLNVGGPSGQTVTTGVMKFKSASDARNVQSWMHRQDLQTPCFEQCIFSPASIAVPGVPGALAVRQHAVGAPPAGPPPAVLALLRRRGITPPPNATTGPPSNYLVEFTIGRYVYFASTGGGNQAGFLAGTKQYYDTVSRLRAS